jgi:putative nucleotidyltransferase with HDIG domain
MGNSDTGLHIYERMARDDKKGGAMPYGLSREEALALLRDYVKNENMIKHCLASEAVLMGLAESLGEEAEKWGLAGLLHDLDIELVNGDLGRHTIDTEKILREKGVDEEIIRAIKLHNEEIHGEKRTERFHHALAAGETITGLIIATTLVYPDKKIGSVKVKSIKKRMKEKSFAASVNRETIMECQKLGMDIDKFAEICLTAMQDIAYDLGL